MRIVFPDTGLPFDVSFPVKVIVSPTFAELIFTLSKISFVSLTFPETQTLYVRVLSSV